MLAGILIVIAFSLLVIDQSAMRKALMCVPAACRHQFCTHRCVFNVLVYVVLCCVVLPVTEGTHPAVVCVAGEEDCITCISTTSNTDLVAVGTKQGRITVWDVNRVLFIMASLTLESAAFVYAVLSFIPLLPFSLR